MTEYLIQAFTENHDLLDITSSAQGDTCWTGTFRDAVRIYRRTTRGVLHDWEADAHSTARVAYFRVYEYVDRCTLAGGCPVVMVTAHGRRAGVNPLARLPTHEQNAHVSPVIGLSLVVPGDLIITPSGADPGRRAEYRLRVTVVSHREADRFAMIRGVVVKKDGSDRLNGEGTGYMRTAWADLSRLIMDTPAATIKATPAAATESSPRPSELLRLPHSGLRVPDRRLRVASLKQLALADGVAWTAALLCDGRLVGRIENDGQGGETFFRPLPDQGFGESELRAYAATCRTDEGTPAEVEAVLEALVHEHEGESIVRGYIRWNCIPARLLTALPGSRTRYPGALRGIPLPADPSARLGVALAALRESPPDRDGMWQVRTGQDWQDVPQAGQELVEVTGGR